MSGSFLLAAFFTVLQGMTGNYGAGGFVNSAVSPVHTERQR